MMRDTRTLKSLFPDPKPQRRKNFIKENVESLRRMEQIMHNDANAAKGLKLPILRKTRLPKTSDDIGYSNVTNADGTSQNFKTQEIIIENQIPRQSRKNPSFTAHSKAKVLPKKLSSSKTNNQTRLKSHSLVDAHSTNKDSQNTKYFHSTYKNQEVQTLDTDDIQSLYSEGVIRYPSGRAKKIEESISIKNSSEYNENEIQIKSMKEMKLGNKLTTLSNAPPSYRVGVVPKYIKERKEALQKEQLAKIAEKNTDFCPPGHVPLPDTERKETLRMLKKNYQEYVSELNMLPIRTDTLRSQKRKIEIEKQLTKLEEAIKVFTRQKVFVKVDA